MVRGSRFAGRGLQFAGGDLRVAVLITTSHTAGGELGGGGGGGSALGDVRPGPHATWSLRGQTNILGLEMERKINSNITFNHIKMMKISVAGECAE
jgi:hypothetical protein